MEKQELTAELTQNFIDYAMAVNTDRSLPDSASGVKPVVRRILYGAWLHKHTSDKAFTKSSRIVGEVMGEFSPHGDASIYEAMARLAKNWVMRYPLIDWHGNVGNVSGDEPAASRYTEARLSPLAEEGMLSGIKKRNVPFGLNYDETLDEPLTLPSYFPSLLCNGQNGIGVAMACNWAPHNLREVATAICNYLDGAPYSIPGPDFPSGGLIINGEALPQIVSSGRGSVKLRSKYRLEGNSIVFYEIPYMVTIEEILSSIGDLCAKGTFPEIEEVFDKSTKNGVEICVTVYDKEDVPVVLARLFAKTKLQTSFAYNQTALVEGKPQLLTLKECLEIYVKQALSCMTLEHKYDLDVDQKRLNIVEAFLTVLADIDEVVHLIKTSESTSNAKTKLIAKYQFNEEAANAILGLKLSSLCSLESKKLSDESETLKKEIKDINDWLADQHLQVQSVKDKIKYLADKYGDDRRTEIVQIAEVQVAKQKKVIEEKSIYVQWFSNGAIKTSVAGKGNYIKCKNTDTLLAFSADNMCYKINCLELKEDTKNIYTMSKAKQSEIYDVVLLNDNDEVYTISALGMVKASKGSEYSSNRDVAICKLKEGDSLVGFLINPSYINLTTSDGYNLVVSSKDFSMQGRATQGLKGIKLHAGAKVTKVSAEKGNVGKRLSVGEKIVDKGKK